VYLGPVYMNLQLVVVAIIYKTNGMPKYHSLHLRIGPCKDVNKFSNKNSVKNSENVVISIDSYCLV
jgi:hypothetical protein